MDLLRWTTDPNYSGKNLPVWFLFNSYLQKKTMDSLKFLVMENFSEEMQMISQKKIDLVYTNPFDWSQYHQKQGYLPLVRPMNRHDEAVLCVKKDSILSSENFVDFVNQHRIKIGSASKDNLIHMVGLFLLDKMEIDRANVDFLFAGSYRGTLQLLLDGKVEAAFIFNDVYDSSSYTIKEMLRVIDQSDDGFAFHAFCLSPEKMSHKEDLIHAFLSMRDDPLGQSILQELGIPGWEIVSPEEIECLESLANEYIAGFEAIDLRSTSSIPLDDSAFLVAREDLPEEGS